MKRMIYHALLVCVLLNFVSAQDLSYAVENDRIVGPTEITSNGYQPITLTNQTDNPVDVVFFRLKEGATLNAFKTALQAFYKVVGPQTEDVRPEVEAMMPLVDGYGGAQIAPSGESTIYVRLEPGTYDIEVSPIVGGDIYLSQTLTVTNGEKVSPPQADLSLHMADFQFDFPKALNAGPQLWKVSNTGEQPHFAYLYKLNKGVSTENFMTWMQTAGPESGPPPAEDADFIQFLTAGQTFYKEVDLAAGNYVALCFLPDLETNTPHVELGMISSFTVQ